MIGKKLLLWSCWLNLSLIIIKNSVRQLSLRVDNSSTLPRRKSPEFHRSLLLWVHDFPCCKDLEGFSKIWSLGQKGGKWFSVSHAEFSKKNIIAAIGQKVSLWPNLGNNMFFPFLLHSPAMKCTLTLNINYFKPWLNLEIALICFALYVRIVISI